MKKLIALALLAGAGSVHAANYYVVVPVPGRPDKQPAPVIDVALGTYSLPNGIAGIAYAGLDFNQLLQVTGDPAFQPTSVTWSLSSGSLPAGLVLNTNGTLAGTPQAAATSNFTVRATYKNKNGEQSYQLLTLAITVNLAAASPPNAEMGAPYSFDLKPALAVTGDPSFNAAQVTWSVVSSTLPVGLLLRTDGTIAGTPTVAGQGAVTVRATYKSKSGEQTYQVLTINIVVGLASTTMPIAQVGSSYSYDFKPLVSVTGAPSYNVSDVTWSVAGGMPAGLSLSAAGVLTGTVPALTGSSANLAVTASYKNKSAQQTYTLSQTSDPYWAQTAALIRMDGAPGSTSFVDLKGGTLTSVGTVITSSPAKFGQAGAFPGGHGKGIVGPVINLPGDFTLEAWVNPSPAVLAATYSGFMGQWNQLGANGGYLIGIQNGAIAFTFFPFDSSVAMMTGPAMQANTWAHVAVTRAGSTFRLFVNGSMVSTATFAGPGNTLTVPFSLGDYFDSNGNFGAAGGFESFTGMLDEVRVTAGVSRYNANFTPATAPLPGR